jgi:hypothetical protein
MGFTIEHIQCRKSSGCATMAKVQSIALPARARQGFRGRWGTAAVQNQDIMTCQERQHL